MKKIIRWTSFALLALIVLRPPALGQTAEDILAKMIDAQGGRENLAKIKDTTMTGTMEMIQMGITGSMTMYHKEPNMMRIDAEFMGMVITQAFDGETGWWINPQTGSVEDIPEGRVEDIKRQAYSMGNDALLHPEKYGITYSLKGKETVDGKECFVLEQVFSDGFKATLYVDAGTHLIAKTIARTTNEMGVEVEAESFYGDYRKVEGMMVPFSLKVLQDGEEAMNMTFSEVSFNTGLEDSLFKRSG